MIDARGIMKRLGLLDVNYNLVSAYGYFGKPGFHGRNNNKKATLIDKMANI